MHACMHACHVCMHECMYVRVHRSTKSPNTLGLEQSICNIMYVCRTRLDIAYITWTHNTQQSCLTIMKTCKPQHRQTFKTRNAKTFEVNMNKCIWHMFELSNRDNTRYLLHDEQRLIEDVLFIKPWHLQSRHLVYDWYHIEMHAFARADYFE